MLLGVFQNTNYLNKYSSSNVLLSFPYNSSIEARGYQFAYLEIIATLTSQLMNFKVHNMSKTCKVRAFFNNQLYTDYRSNSLFLK